MPENSAEILINPLQAIFGIKLLLLFYRHHLKVVLDWIL